MVLFMAYSATFLSHLTVRRRELQFRDIQSFLNDGTYKLFAIYGSAEEAYLKVTYIYIITDAYGINVNTHRVHTHPCLDTGHL
jgi:hypothetical protein